MCQPLFSFCQAPFVNFVAIGHKNIIFYIFSIKTCEQHTKRCHEDRQNTE